MSVIWELDSLGTHYSVRRSGASIRLYSNRVFHSQWNANKPFAGGVWDCLSLPVLYRPVECTRRILLLGVGGGAVIRQLQQLCQFSHLSGVEVDAQHLQIARFWFGVNDERVELIHADAIRWLADYDGEPFDLIIDDLFGHQEGEPVRACPLTAYWVSLLREHLDTRGILVVNCVNAPELKRAVAELSDAGFGYGYRWTLPAYENAIGVLSPDSLQARDWSRHLENSGLDTRAQRQARSTIRRPLRYLKL
ncbi:MAG: class I SAM-dependent methyltransferase [Granulosicoccus sp.]|nr:class I SAM-dependent methyltransferase [Granulosicoccus sp.]